MIGLKVYVNGNAEIKDMDPDDLYSEVGGEPEDTRPFVDNTIAVITNRDAGINDGKNVILPCVNLYGTVLFLKSRGQSYVDMSDEMIDMLLDRFPKIQRTEDRRCGTSLSLRERFIAWLTRIFKGSR